MTEQENCRKPESIVNLIIDCATKYLMSSKDGLTCYNGFVICGNIFFRHLSRDRKKLCFLLNQFMKHGDKIENPDAIIGLPYALAKLSQERALFGLLTEQNLLVKMLDLCLNTLSTNPIKPIVQRCSLLALCRTANELPSIDAEHREKIAKYYYDWLETSNPEVLEVTVRSIRLLLNAGVCMQEMLHDDMIERVATTLDSHMNHENITTSCCEILSIVSFHRSTHQVLSSSRIVSILYTVGKMNKLDYIKIMVCTCLCNVSSTKELSLIEQGIVSEMSLLSANSAHNEILQELCARTLCNISCVKLKHEILIEEGILGSIGMAIHLYTASIFHSLNPNPNPNFFFAFSEMALISNPYF